MFNNQRTWLVVMVIALLFEIHPSFAAFYQEFEKLCLKEPLTFHSMAQDLERRNACYKWVHVCESFQVSCSSQTLNDIRKELVQIENARVQVIAEPELLPNPMPLKKPSKSLRGSIKKAAKKNKKREDSRFKSHLPSKDDLYRRAHRLEQNGQYENAYKVYALIQQISPNEAKAVEALERLRQELQ